MIARIKVSFTLLFVFSALISFGQSIPIEDASRFLGMASTGGNLEDLQHLAELGYEDWISEQIQISPFPLLATTHALIAANSDTKNINISPHPFRFALWDMFLNGEDILRQRVTLALSEIFVISDHDNNLKQSSPGMASYYEALSTYAFGNFRDLLQAVTYHPCMGIYLSHLGNQKGNEAIGTFPDENYAREIMQLFTIGLYELNLDGSRKLDSEGNEIPTYTNDQITAYARAFTGFTSDLTQFQTARPSLSDDRAFELAQKKRYRDLSRPMVTIDSRHDQGTKQLLNGRTLGPNRSADQDISDALDSLFHHDNVGPFIGRLLIQRLVTSNPSPAYIQRVASTFENNGNGIRGDMTAVIRAILLDQEALHPQSDHDTYGKMREPFIRMLQLIRAFDGRDPLGRPYNQTAFEIDQIGQRPFSSPSVFNFFSPNYAPSGPIADAGKVAPEFQISHTQTLPGFANLIESILTYENWAENQVQRRKDQNSSFFSGPFLKPWLLNLDGPLSIAKDTTKLIDHLSLLLTAGKLEDPTRSVIKEQVDGLNNQKQKVRLAIYLIMLSPDYVIETN